MALREAPSEVGEVHIMEDALAALKGGVLLHRSNPHGPYEVQAYTDGDFLENKDPLTKLVIAVAQRELGWSEEDAAATYERALHVKDPQEESLIPSVLVFSREGVLAGISAQKLRYIETTSMGKVPVEFHIIRAFEPLDRGKHMGRDSIELGRFIHRKAEYYIARNTGPVPVYATMQTGKEKEGDESDIFVDGTFHPWERRYDQEGSDRVYQELMVATHMTIRGPESIFADPSTSVSKHDLPDYNHSYRPSELHRPTNDLLVRMTEEFGMKIEERDSIITVAKFR